MPSFQNIIAKDIMTKSVVSVEAGEYVSRVAKMLFEKKIHHVAVFEDGEYAGLFGYKQMLRLHSRDTQSAKIKPTNVKNYIVKPPKIAPDTGIVDIADYMYRLNYKVLPVFDGKKLAGIVSEGDVMRAIAGAGELAKRNAGEFMTPSPETVSVDDDLGHAVALMKEHNLSRLPVIGKEGKVAGLIESINLMRMLSAKEDSGRGDSSISHAPSGGAVSASGGATHAPDSVTSSEIAVRSIMQESPVLSLAGEEIAGKIAELSKRPEISTIIVVDAQSRPVGVISPKDIIQHIAALKEREVQYIQISGLESIEAIDDFQKLELHKAIDVTAKKIAKSEKIHSFAIHVKAYHTGAKKPKYAMRAKVKTDKAFVAVKTWGWDPIEACANLMKEVERAVIGGSNKRRDNIRKALRNSKEAEREE